MGPAGATRTVGQTGDSTIDVLANALRGINPKLDSLMASYGQGAKQEDEDAANRELARMLGDRVQHTTIRNWVQSDHPRIASQMAGEEPARGTREATRDDEGGFYNTVVSALDTAASNARAVHDPGRRGAMIEAVERLLKGLQGDGKWDAVEF